jgi:metal-responsive CopG/Arc/MetJ family transcriptional regulator
MIFSALNSRGAQAMTGERFDGYTAAKRLRVTVTLPPTVVADLDYIAGRIGVTRSALLSDLVTEPLADLAHLVRLVPDNPVTPDLRYAHGESQRILRERLTAYVHAAESFSGTLDQGGGDE